MVFMGNWSMIMLGTSSLGLANFIERIFSLAWSAGDFFNFRRKSTYLAISSVGVSLADNAFLSTLNFEGIGRVIVLIPI